MSRFEPSVADLTTLGAKPTTRDGRTTWWFRTPSASVTRWLAEHDLTPDRRLHQMRVVLPLHGVASTTTRAFRPGSDDAALLRVNNAAFSWHPEQGGWTSSDLHRRMAEPWFEADGLRIADLDDDGDVDGFCWMKPHADDPPMGEIHVIAVDPARQGRGLGSSLAAAGLAWAGRRWGVHIGMLFVEADNAAAVSVYRRLGFTVHHTDLGLIGPDPDH